MTNIQQESAQIAAQYSLSTSAAARYIDLCAEIGELGKELLIGSDYDSIPLQTTDNTAKELGDIVFSLAMLANSLDLDLQCCFDQAIDKYRKRFESSEQIGSLEDK